MFTVTPNLEGTFRLGKNSTTLCLIKDHCVESNFFCFLISTLKKHKPLHVYKYWFEPVTLQLVVLWG